jgi:hypothetical protein
MKSLGDHRRVLNAHLPLGKSREDRDEEGDMRLGVFKHASRIEVGTRWVDLGRHDEIRLFNESLIPGFPGTVMRHLKSEVA